VAQFGVYRNPNPATRQTVPYLLDVQNDLFETLNTRLVVPLIKESANSKPIGRLNPRFEIEGKKVFMSTAEMAGISTTDLGEYVGSLQQQRGEIVDAVDFLVVGF